MPYLWELLMNIAAGISLAFSIHMCASVVIVKEKERTEFWSDMYE